MMGSKVTSWPLAMLLSLFLSSAVFGQLHIQLEVYEVSTTIGDCDGFLGGDSDPAWRWLGADIINQCYETTCNGCTRSISEILYDQTFSCLSEVPNSIDVTFKGCENDGAGCAGGTFTGICDGTSAEVTTTFNLPTTAGTTNLSPVSGTSSGCAGTWTYKARWVVTGTAYAQSNDAICDAEAIPLLFNGSGFSAGSNHCATIQTNEIQSADSTISLNNTVWYSFVANSTNFRVSTNSSLTDFNTELSVYEFNSTGSICFLRFVQWQNLLEVGSNDNISANNTKSRVDIYCASPGTTYFVQIDGNSAADTGNFGLYISALTAYSDTSQVDACDSYTWAQNGLTYFNSGIYSDTMSSIGGCDSILFLNLSIHSSSYQADTIEVTECHQYRWPVNNQVFLQSGIFSDTVLSSHGCDSAVCLVLTIHPKYSAIRDTVLQACEPYQWSQNGEYYSESGVYYDTLQSVDQCDSLIGLYLIRESSDFVQETYGIYGSSRQWGRALDINSDLMVVGSPVGSTIVQTFRKLPGPGWVSHVQITHSGVVSSDLFGASLALNESYLAIGAPHDDVIGKVDQGRVFMYRRDLNTVSGIQVQQSIVSSDGQPSDFFGQSVAISGDLALVGAPNAIVSSARSGAAYLFQRNSNGNWIQIQKLVASDGSLNDYFGNSLAISGNYAIVGASNDDDNGVQSGAVYLFQKQSSGQWAEIQKLVASDGGSVDFYGYRVAMDGHTAVVGAYNADGSKGAAYILELGPLGQWVEIQKLQPSVLNNGDQFGIDVDVDGDRILIGANRHDFIQGVHKSDAGTAFLFEKTPDGKWRLSEQLSAANGLPDDWFGRAVAIDNENLAIAATGTDRQGVSLNGSAYLFRNCRNTIDTLSITSCDSYTWPANGITYTQSGLFSAFMTSNKGCDSTVYLDLSINSSYNLVSFATICGSYTWNVNGQTYFQSGAYTSNYQSAGGCDSNHTLNLTVHPVYLTMDSVTNCDPYHWPQTNETYYQSGLYYDTTISTMGCDSIVGLYFLRIATKELNTLIASDADSNDFFGNSVAVYGRYSIIGAPMENDLGGNSGAAYLFKINPHGQWEQIQKITALDGNSGDRFGTAVSLFDRFVIIGAPGDDIFGPNSGSAYIFYIDTSDQCTQVSKILPQGADFHIGFGSSVNIHKDHAIVGTPYDAMTGFDQGVVPPYHGAAYVYKRNGMGQWNLVKQLVPPDGADQDHFGSAVAINSHFALIGSEDHDSQGSQSGAAYLYKNNNGQWLHTQKLTASDANSNDFFGFALALHDQTAVVGAPSNLSSFYNQQRRGGAYVFHLNGNQQWIETQKLTPVGWAALRFGNAIDIHGDLILVGSVLEENGTYTQGSAYLFERDSVDYWHQSAHLWPTAGGWFEYVAKSVALYKNHVLIGAPKDMNNGLITGGVFGYHHSAWTDTNTISSCGQYYLVSNGRTFNQSGLFIDTLISSNGCDSLDFMDITIHPTFSDTLEARACHSFTWMTTAQTYGQSGIYVDSSLTSWSCDSLAYLNLLIDNAEGLEAGVVGTYRVVLRWKDTGSNNYVVRTRLLGDTQWQTFLSTDTSRILQNRAPGDYEYYIVDLDNGDSSCVDQFSVNCATDITYTFNAFQAPELGRLGRVRVFGTQGGKRLYDIHLVNEEGDSNSALNVRQRNYTDLPAGDYSLYVRDDFGCEAASVGQFTINAMDTNFIPNLINAPNNPPNGFRPTWHSVAGVINYQLRVVNVTDGTLQLFQTGINDTMYAVTNLPTGKLYRFNVRSRYNNGVANVVSGYSNPASRNLPAGGNKEVEQGELAAEGVFGQINIYPNPTSDLLYVQAPEGSTLTLIDMNGKAIARRTVKEVEEMMDFTELAQGVYLLEVNSGGQLYRERVVKQ